MKTLDAIVIGSGQGGTPLSKKLANAGFKTLLVEKRLVGGTCINDGCTPTKTLIGHANIAERVRKSEHWNIFTPGMSIDYEAIWNHKNQVVNSFRGSSEKGIQATEGLELVFGEATFIGHKTIQVTFPEGGTQVYRAERIYINAGCRPAIPDIPGLSVVPYLTSSTLLDLQHIPGQLIIIGGSYIALEMAQLFHRLGSRVTVLERASQLLSKEDADVSACIRDILQEEGISIITNAETERVEKPLHDGVIVHVNQEGKTFMVSGTHLLVAAGRKPNTDILRVNTTGLETDNHGYIKVNSYLETNVEGIYALGDVKGGPAFTHVSYNDYVIIIRNLLENKRLSTEGRLNVYCMFTDPQLGHVGLTEREAKEQQIPYLRYTLPMTRVARAIESGNTKGMMKAITHKETGEILGASIIGEQGGETMTVLQMAMQAGFTSEDIRYQLFAHPLYAESLNNLFMQEGQ